jgi:hypothetical protein
MMPDSSFPLQGAVGKGHREEDRGALLARLRPLGQGDAPKHVRERGEYQDYFSSLSRSRSSRSSMRPSTYALSSNRSRLMLAPRRFLASGVVLVYPADEGAAARKEKGGL